MKKLLLFIAVGTLSVCTLSAQQTGDTGTTQPPPAAKPAPRPGALTDAERKELNKARADALKANPDLVAEGKDLDAKRKALQKKIDEAAVAADPAVAPILAKIAPIPPPAKVKPADKPTEKTSDGKATPVSSTNAPAATPPGN